MTGHLFAEIQDSELSAAVKLKTVSSRAAGAVAGVVLERHLQRVAVNHKIPIRKKDPTIADLNDPLKQKGCTMCQCGERFSYSVTFEISVPIKRPQNQPMSKSTN